MGYPMAGHLRRAGLETRVFNRTTQKALQWVENYGGESAASPGAAAQNAKLVFACVGNDNDVREIVLGKEGAFSGMEPGSIFVDHTTTSAMVARELAAEAEKRGLHFMDAPVSGGQQGAENGKLTIMCGGEPEIYAEAEPVMAYYAKISRLMGPAGCGQLCKMVNQICAAGLLEGLAEGLHFAKVAGLDAHRVVEVISQGAAQSWQMDNRHETMLAGEYLHGFAVDWMRKDLDIILGEAKARSIELPVTSLVNSFYAEVQAMGGGRWDTSSLLARLESQADGKAD